MYFNQIHVWLIGRPHSRGMVVLIIVINFANPLPKRENGKSEAYKGNYSIT